jgi:hypothetical protein
MSRPGADKNERRTQEHGNEDCVRKNGTASILDRRLREPKQDGSDAPTEDREDMPACPKDADMTFANDAATVSWDQPALAHAAKDEKLTEYGVHETD